MEISEALTIIKEGFKKKPSEAKHFLDQCKDRNLDANNINNIITNNEILGIVKQDQNLYKVWLFYERSKDLNIILRILPDKKLRLITIFPCNSDRRTR